MAPARSCTRSMAPIDSTRKHPKARESSVAPLPPSGVELADLAARSGALTPRRNVPICSGIFHLEGIPICRECGAVPSSSEETWRKHKAHDRDTKHNAYPWSTHALSRPLLANAAEQSRSHTKRLMHAHPRRAHTSRPTHAQLTRTHARTHAHTHGRTPSCIGCCNGDGTGARYRHLLQRPGQEATIASEREAPHHNGNITLNYG